MSYVKNIVEKYNVDVQVGKKQKTEKDDSNNNDAIVQSILTKITENNVNDITQMSLQKIGIKGSDISKAGGIKQIKTLLKTFVTKSEPIIIQNDS